MSNPSLSRRYVGDVTYELDVGGMLPYDVMKAAEGYGLDRLAALCRNCVA
jgi:hypothetical protein